MTDKALIKELERIVGKAGVLTSESETRWYKQGRRFGSGRRWR